MRAGFACCLHQGASGRCWVSKAGFLIIWSPAHRHGGGSCLFLRFHTAPHCLIANGASPHRQLSSMCATPLWSMANKYERPGARRGMEGGILMVHLWSLQTLYEGNDWMVPRNKWEGEERCQICMDVMAHTNAPTLLEKRGQKKPKEWFCISLAATSRALLFRCSVQFLAVSTSYQKQVLFSPQRVAFFFRRGGKLATSTETVLTRSHSFLILKENKRTVVEGRVF